MYLSSRVKERLRTWLQVSGSSRAKPRVQQVLEILWLAGTCEYSPGEYYIYGFHIRGVTQAQMLCYMPSRVHFSKHLKFSVKREAHPYLENKWFFYLHFSSLGIKTPTCFGVFHPQFGFTSGGGDLKGSDDLCSFFKTRDLQSVIAKPISGTSGKGVLKIDVRKEDGVLHFSQSGVRTDLDSLMNMLNANSTGGAYSGVLFQDYVVQHSELSRLSPTACMNIRVVTIRRPNGSVVVSSASTRIGRLGSVMSNAGSGGILAKIDPCTGKITACTTGLYIDAKPLLTHPDTGYGMVDFQIPYWDEIVELCTDAAKYAPGAVALGWDVVVTETGPEILEANHDWDMISEQLFGEGYLSRENRGYMSEHGLEFSQDRFPRFSPRKLFQFFR